VRFIAATPLNEPITYRSQYSSFLYLNRVTAWTRLFDSYSRTSKSDRTKSSLTIVELAEAKRCWLIFLQECSLTLENATLKWNYCQAEEGDLIAQRSILDSKCVLCVSGPETKYLMSYAKIHLNIVRGKHPETKLIIRHDHLPLLHAGSTLLSASIGRRYHIVTLWSHSTLTRQCTIVDVKPPNHCLRLWVSFH